MGTRIENRVSKLVCFLIHLSTPVRGSWNYSFDLDRHLHESVIRCHQGQWRKSHQFCNECLRDFFLKTATIVHSLLYKVTFVRFESTREENECKFRICILARSGRRFLISLSIRMQVLIGNEYFQFVFYNFMLGRNFKYRLELTASYHLVHVAFCQRPSLSYHDPGVWGTLTWGVGFGI
jgi:hypothetical protein